MSDVKVKVFTGSGSINFEEDQREDLNSVNDAKSLSDQVVKLKNLEDELEEKEKELKFPRYIKGFGLYLTSLIQ